MALPGIPASTRVTVLSSWGTLIPTTTWKGEKAGEGEGKEKGEGEEDTEMERHRGSEGGREKERIYARMVVFNGVLQGWKWHIQLFGIISTD